MDSEQRDAGRLVRVLNDLLAAAKGRPFTVGDRAAIYMLAAELRRALEQREAVPVGYVRQSGGSLIGELDAAKVSVGAMLYATPPRDVPENVLAEAINRAIAAVEPMYGERQDTWIARVREHARAMLAAAPSGEVG